MGIRYSVLRIFLPKGDVFVFFGCFYPIVRFEALPSENIGQSCHDLPANGLESRKTGVVCPEVGQNHPVALEIEAGSDVPLRTQSGVGRCQEGLIPQ